MASSFEGKVAESLMEKIATIPTIDIAYPNVSFDPNGAYIDVSFIPNGNVNQPLSGEGTRQGIVRLTLVEKIGEISIAHQDAAGTIAELFPSATKLFFTGGYIKFTSDPEVGQSFPSDEKIRTPITLFYQATRS